MWKINRKNGVGLFFLFCFVFFFFGEGGRFVASVFVCFVSVVVLVFWHRESFMNSCVPSGKSKWVGFKSFNSFLTLIICWQSFLLEISLSPDRLLFVEVVVRFEFLLININSNMLQNLLTVFSRALCRIEFDMLIISALSLRENSTFLQHWHSRKATSFTRTSLTFLQKLNIWFKLLEVTI